MTVRTSGVVLRGGLAVLALAGIAVAVRVMLAPEAPAFSLYLFGAHLHVADPSRPLWAAAVASAALAVLTRASGFRAAALALLSISGVLALVTLARHAPFTPPVGDVGVIESYIFDALHGRLFLGPYSRFQWHHPGPVYFLLLAPFYVLSGYRTAGVAAGALAINIASIAFAAWTVRRAAGPRTATAVTVACAIYAARMPRLLTSQWNPLVLVFPTLAFVVAAAAVAAGHIELIPALFALATFAVQTHLGLAPTVAVIGACALAPLLAGPWRLRNAEERRRFWWLLNAGFWIAAALWFLPIVEEITGSPGNLTRLWAFFAHGSAGQPFAAAFAAWSGALTGIVRRDFVLAWGGPLLPGSSPVPGILAIALVALVCAIGVAAARAGRRFQAALAALILAGAATAFWSATRIVGEIFDHEVFWMSALGVLAVALFVDAALGAAEELRVRATAARMSDAVTVALLAVTVWLGVSDLKLGMDQLSRPGNEETAASTLSDGIIAFARDEHVSKMRIEIDGPAWAVAAAVIVELERAGVPFAVGPGAVWMFGPASAPDGTETRAVYISAEGAHASLAGKPGMMALAERRGFYADAAGGP